MNKYKIKLIINFLSLILEGDGRIDRENYNNKYNYNQAKISFERVAKSHGWM